MKIHEMTPEQRAARSGEKRQALLEFLGAGEVWTTAEIAAQLWGLKKTAAHQTLSGMVRDGLLKSEAHLLAGRKTLLFGITSHGLALVDAPPNYPVFELGRTNTNTIPHQVALHRARLTLAARGWHSWCGGKTLFQSGLKKVPDGLMTDDKGRVWAIEVERNIKTLKRYREVISAHLEAIVAKRWARVLYLTPDGLRPRLERVMAAVETVKVPEGVLPLSDQHRARFVVRDFSQIENGGE